MDATTLLTNTVGQAAEYFSIQAFLPECAVKTFTTAVLPWLAWLNIGQLNMLFFHLFPQGCRNQFAAIITANGPRPPVTCKQHS